MKNSKLFKSLSVLAITGIMAFSSLSFAYAEEEDVIKVEVDGNVSEKAIHTIKIEDIVHYSNGDISQIRYVNGSVDKEIFATEGSYYSFLPMEYSDKSIIPITEKVEGIVGCGDATITFHYTSDNKMPGNLSDFTGWGESDYLLVNVYTKDSKGNPIDGITVKADNCLSTGDYYMGEWVTGGYEQSFPESKTKNGAVGYFVNNLLYSAMSYDVKYVIDDDGDCINGKLEGNKCLKLKNASDANCTYTILDTKNNKIADVIFSDDDIWKSDISLNYEIKNLNADWDVKVEAKYAKNYDVIKSGNDIIKDGFNNTTQISSNDSAIIANITVTLKEDATENKSGLCKDADGNWYYYVNGKVDQSYTGMAKNKYGWWYVKKGKLDQSYTGMARNQHGWFYMKNGKLDLSYTGMARNQYGWFYMKNGKLDLSYTGMARNQYGWFYMKNGKLDLSYTGMARNQYGWFYMKNGKLDQSYTGMAKNQYGWFYMKNGKLDQTYTGIAKNAYGTWYMQNGKLDTKFSGKVTLNGKTYTIKNGKVM